ncbi:MAG: hypothetical protein JSV42_02040 [Chloroflexota bacterium]|nr:MAG: hypothetical protein JSV42_02040 [Chloroflexota bacterium]
MLEKRFLLVLIILIISIFVTACTANGESNGDASQVISSFADIPPALQSAGFAVEASGSIVQPFFEPEAKIITVNDQEIQVFEFVTVSEALSAAETISPEGSSIGTSMVTWISPPHFYQVGRLIILYLGDDPEIMKALEGLLGPQIAGG